MRDVLRTAPGSGEFTVDVDWRGGTTVFVRMHGALDLYSIRDARRALLAQLDRHPKRIVIDVSDASVDSSGIGLLVHVAQRVSMEHGALRVVCDRQLADVLRLHRLDRLVPIAETVDDALEWGGVRVRSRRDHTRAGDRGGAGLRKVA